RLAPAWIDDQVQIRRVFLPIDHSVDGCVLAFRCRQHHASALDSGPAGNIRPASDPQKHTRSTYGLVQGRDWTRTGAIRRAIESIFPRGSRITPVQIGAPVAIGRLWAGL